MASRASKSEMHTATSWALTQRPLAAPGASGVMLTALLLYLAADADLRHAGRGSQASVGAIAAGIQVDRATAQRGLRVLEAAGLIATTPGGGRGNPSTYTLQRGGDVRPFRGVRVPVKGRIRQPHTRRVKGVGVDRVSQTHDSYRPTPVRAHEDVKRGAAGGSPAATAAPAVDALNAADEAGSDWQLMKSARKNACCTWCGNATMAGQPVLWRHYTIGEQVELERDGGKVKRGDLMSLHPDCASHMVRSLHQSKIDMLRSKASRMRQFIPHPHSPGLIEGPDRQPWKAGDLAVYYDQQADALEAEGQ